MPHSPRQYSGKRSTAHAQFAEGLHFSAFHSKQYKWPEMITSQLVMIGTYDIWPHIRVHAYPTVYTHSQPLSNIPCYNVFVQLATLMYYVVMSLLSYLMDLDSKMYITGQRFLNTRWSTWYIWSFMHVHVWLSKMHVQVQL